MLPRPHFVHVRQFHADIFVNVVMVYKSGAQNITELFLIFSKMQLNSEELGRPFQINFSFVDRSMYTYLEFVMTRRSEDVPHGLKTAESFVKLLLFTAALEWPETISSSQSRVSSIS